MAAIIDGEKKSDADLVAQAKADAQDKAIDKAIADAFVGSNERLTAERINNLQLILSQIIDVIEDARIQAQQGHQQLTLTEIVDKLLKEREIKILAKELPKLFGLSEKIQEEVKVEKEGGELGVGNLDELVLNKNFICAIDKILEDKKRSKVIENLSLQDSTVKQEFAVGVREQLEKDGKTSGAKVNKYYTSAAVMLGGACFGTGLNMIIVAGSIAAAGAFPIGLAVVGGVLIIGAALYYAKKKHERVSKILPALYRDAEQSRDLQIKHLDRQERLKKATRLAEKCKKKNEKDTALATNKIAAYTKKHERDYNLICDKIDALEKEVNEIDVILNLKLSSPAEFKTLQKKYALDNNFNRTRAFKNISGFDDFKEFKDFLRQRKNEIQFGKDGLGGGVETELGKIKTVLADNIATDDWTAFKTTHALNKLPGIEKFNDTKSFKEYLVKRAGELEKIRAGSLTQLKESRKNYEDALEAETAKINGELEKQKAANEASRELDSSVIETKPSKKNKSNQLKWYKQIGPYFAYWGACIAYNFRSNAVVAEEARKVLAAAAQRAKEQQSGKEQQGDKGLNFSAISELKAAGDLADTLEQARGKFGDRVEAIIKQLDLRAQDNALWDYLTIEECYTSDETYEEKIARLISGNEIKGIMLDILYTHPSTVLSLHDAVNDNITASNINTALKDAELKLLAVKNNLDCLNSLQIYFPPDKKSYYERFMLVSNETKEEREKQEALFRHILAVKQSIMEVNKTLHAVSKMRPENLENIKQQIKEKTARLIETAIPAVEKIEEQLDQLDVAAESNRYREAYINIFKDLSDETTFGDCIKGASFSDAILILDDADIKDFVKIFESHQLDEGILKEFVEIFSDGSVSPEKKFNFFQKAKAVAKDDQQLRNLQKEYKTFFAKRSFPVASLKKLDDTEMKSDADLSRYIKNNEHMYHSQRVLIDQKRSVLEEIQKSLVLSIPEIEDTLQLEATHKFRRKAKKRRVNYGIPYNPSMSLSLDYISDLFKSTRLAFGKIKGRLSGLNFSEMNIRDINFSLGEISGIVGDKNIPIAFNNAMKYLDKIRGIEFPGFNFDLMFGSLFDKMRTEGEVLNETNQKIVVEAIEKLRKFLSGIPYPFNEYSLPDLMYKIKEMSLRIGNLSIELARLNPLDINDALKIKKIILELNALRMDFNKFDISMGEFNLKGLVGGLPDGFPGKDMLKAFSKSFDPFFDGFKSMSLEFGKLDFNAFPLDDFLYICNCYNGFGGFGDLMPNFLDWLKKYAELDREIKAMEKNRKKGDTNKYNKLKRDFDDIRIKLEKFGKFKMCLGNVSGFLLENLEFKLPTFLSGVPGISVEGLKTLSLNLNEYGNFSLDDMSFVIKFLGDFKGIDGITADLGSLKLSIDDLWKRIQSFKRSNSKQDGEELARLKNDLKIAMRRFEMFKDFSVKIGRLSELLPAIPEFSGIDLFEVDFAGITRTCGEFFEGFETTLKGINLSLDLYGGMIDIKNRLSNIKVDFPKLGISEIKLTWDLPWPTFSSLPRERSNKTKKERKTDSSSKFDLDFGDLDFNLKVIDLDEIIKRLEELRKLNKDTRERIIKELKSDVAAEVRKAIGLKPEDEEKFVSELKAGSFEVEKNLDVTLFSLYTIKATMAIINAIKRGGEQDDSAVATELVNLAGKVPGLQSEINVIVDNLNMLKEFSSKTDEDLKKIESLKKDLALKEQELQDIKSGLFELKRLREAFLKSDKITVDTIKYDEPPVLNMLTAMGITAEEAKEIVNKIVGQATKLSEETINAAVNTVELAEITIKLSPLVDTIKKIDRKDFTSELKDLLEEADKLTKEVENAQRKGIKKFNERLSRLRSIESRLLELKQLADRASEIPSVDFTKVPYSVALQPLGLSGAMVTSFVENAKEISSKKIDDALHQLKLAEIPLKIAALNKNITVLSEAHVKPLLELLKSDRKFEGLNLGRLVENWRSQARDPLDLFKLIDAVKNAESLFNELEQAVQLGSGAQKQALVQYRAALNRLAGQPADQDINILFSNIHDFCNITIITQAQAEALVLKTVLSAGVDQAQDALVSMNAGEFMQIHGTGIRDFLAVHEGLMQQLHEYHELMRISKKLNNIDKMKNAAPEDIVAFKERYQKVIRLENKMNDFLRQKTRVAELLDKVSVPERKADGVLEAKQDIGVENVEKLKEFLNGLEMFYDLNNPQIVYQNLESAKSLYQALQANEAQQESKHDRPMLFSRGATVGEEDANKPTVVASKKKHKQRRDSLD